MKLNNTLIRHIVFDCLAKEREIARLWGNPWDKLIRMYFIEKATRDIFRLNPGYEAVCRYYFLHEKKQLPQWALCFIMCAIRDRYHALRAIEA